MQIVQRYKQTCTKRRHYSKKDAKNALKKIKMKHSENTPNHVYYCEQCSSWHLTSMTREKAASLKFPQSKFNIE